MVEVTSTVSLSVSVRVWVCVTSDATSHVSVVVSVAMQLVSTVTGSRTVEVRTDSSGGSGGSGRVMVELWSGEENGGGRERERVVGSDAAAVELLLETGGENVVELAIGYGVEPSAVVVVVVVVVETTLKVVHVPIVPGGGIDVPLGRGNGAMLENGDGNTIVPVPAPLPLALWVADELDRVKVGQVRVVDDRRMLPVLNVPMIEVEFGRGKGIGEAPVPGSVAVSLETMVQSGIMKDGAEGSVNLVPIDRATRSGTRCGDVRDRTGWEIWQGCWLAARREWLDLTY